MKKVSIIIPVYNVEPYMERCLLSALNQTYDNIEIILVDDCGQDNSIEVAKRVVKGHRKGDKVRVLKHQHNRGLSAARNTGTYASTGEFIYYLDSDDEITPHCIATLVALAEKYPDVEMVQGNRRCVPKLKESKISRLRKIITHKNSPEYVNDNDWVNKQYLSNFSNSIPVNAWNKLIKRDFIFQNKYFFKEGIIHEDMLWMFWVVKKLKIIAFTTEYTYTYFIREGSIMQSKDKYPNVNSKYIILSEIFDNNSGLSKMCNRKYLYSLWKSMNIIDSTMQDKNIYLRYKLLLTHLLRKEWNDGKSFIISMLYLLYTPRCFLRSYAGKIIGHVLLKIEQYI
jgi:glycosyltransferase involved in cell wall biosynthesis